MNETITLISHILSTDADGYETESEPIEIDVSAKICSMSQTEFFNASQAGLKPKVKATIWKCEYGGQREVVYCNAAYEVYRTYTAGEYIELYLTQKAGV